MFFIATSWTNADFLPVPTNGRNLVGMSKAKTRQLRGLSVAAFSITNWFRYFLLFLGRMCAVQQVRDYNVQHILLELAMTVMNMVIRGLVTSWERPSLGSWTWPEVCIDLNVVHLLLQCDSMAVQKIFREHFLSF